jgi:hypothetical protein
MGVSVSESRTRAAVTLSAAFASGALALCATCLGPAGAQPAPPNPPPTQALPRPVIGFVSSYEILRTVRAAGFDPLAPPLRDGTMYVLRATDFRGILMRVVLDARTGVIRDVTRIVPADSGPYGMMSSPYGPPPYGPPPYGPPPYAAPAYGPPPYDARAEGPPTELAAPRMAPKKMHAAPSARASLPPLPRPRPELASQQPQKPTKGQAPAPAHPMDAQPRAAASPTGGINASDAPAAPAASTKTPAAVPLND